MKNVSTLSTSIHRISILPFGMMNAFLLVNSSGCILVDSGLPGTEDKVNKVLKKLNLTFTDIKVIVITHAHVDHAGNAVKLKALSGAQIIAHEGDLPYFLGEKKMHFCLTGWAGWLLNKLGANKQPYERFSPDILLTGDDEFDLNEYGIDGKVIPTIGHTEGSISVLVDNHRAVVGDLISSGIALGGIMRTGKAKRPPFEDNPIEVSQELQSIVDQGFETFFMGHGGPLPQKEVKRHIKQLKKLAKQ